MKTQKFVFISIALLISTIFINPQIYAQNSGWVDDGSIVRLETRSDGVGIGTKRPQGRLDVGGGKFVVKVNGNIGIGTTRPSEKVDIMEGNLRIQSDDGHGFNLADDSGNDKWGFYYDNASGDFRVWDYINSIDRLVISNGGNIGIGTTNPKEKLEVNGAIKVGNTTGTNAGTMRWTGTAFEGFNGTDWIKLGGAPDFDSGWFSMSSQAGTNSYQEITHNLGVYPSRVKVLVKAIDGPNEGFIFEGSGVQHADDDNISQNYGGVVFAYDQTRVRLWAPSFNNTADTGSIIMISDGWGGEVNGQSSHTADVKVLVWR